MYDRLARLFIQEALEEEHADSKDPWARKTNNSKFLILNF
jgi:hypothetical protein